jgi:hypothetical protein
MARIKELKDLTLKEMMFNFQEYSGLPDGLVQLPVPERIKIKGKYYSVPEDYEQFTKSLCYGQRLFLSQKEDKDFGVIIRVIDGYYYSLVTGNKWDADKALLFGKYVLHLHVKDLYPVAMHLINLVAELAEREKQLLFREPSKIELAAGIEKLNIFSELSSLDFLRDAMKITIAEVLLTPYKECLVRFMIAKETEEYRERYFQLIQETTKPKSKYKQDGE